jgi:hypothetical protein
MKNLMVMDRKQRTFIYLFILPVLLSWMSVDDTWTSEHYDGFTMNYTGSEKKNTQDYFKLINEGRKTVQSFFKNSYKNDFEVFIHPNRHSLDSTWQKDWNMPDFKSECWMVASGVAARMDMISPKLWNSEACEHDYSNSLKTQQLITHELVHVYHGQLNPSPDFSNVTGIDWFVEGLATYASGQCDSVRMSEVKKAIEENNVPPGLDQFWTGKLKYGLSGSLVMFVDEKYGRAKLTELLKTDNLPVLLLSLNTDEAELIDSWKTNILKH